MKVFEKLLGACRPLFEEGRPLRPFHPVFQAADNLLFAPETHAQAAPFVRDALDLKRYMSMVIVALLPCFAASVYFFGWRVLLMLVVSYVAGGTVEVVFAIVRKEDIAEGFLVTGFIFPLILPPGTPLWMVAVGIIFGVIVGKEVFGGTGRNLFNAALIGRCFLSIGYPATMASAWVPPARGLAGKLLALPAFNAPDAIAAATPLVLAGRGEWASYSDLLWGRVLGSTGETSSIAVIVGGVFLMAVGVANWRTVAGVVVGFSSLSLALHVALPAQAPPLGFALLAGGLLFGALFMATDPVTSPVTQSGKWAYGALIGTVTALIRVFSGYTEGVTFAILLGNCCAPLIDEAVIRGRMRRHARAR
ncbi:MAG: RnfABCDGE type electron transport complex subunit D [Lentisphaerae bacterium]|jgi:Na(+)-translocating NADH:ubiquinone oxidoreductase B subunit|nr:RnfABCDGE type electron transport complex subunit D [Lentisphaerota bacterium]MBT4821253.1 RnfABCDGE type electron transport complex subunit D [Lentisphaerota bacterium]MBT5606373.1 RnfABCDGE type electron transport complex subunit D [Lentisphaerota bacterium]MBT7056772.1 RnfABCDGE type electron transport complex subunit D [Lentisphaerota bacterium]MBT7840377.1 RnfABCDGE type electron transport complex subunit D [Lentisphaerota bacterium]